jgi:hypothetical protein
MCGLGGCMCVLGSSFGRSGAVWWMFKWYCFELIPLWGVEGSSHTVVDQAEPQSSTLWRLSYSV